MEMALDIHQKEKEVDALKKDDEIKTLELHNTRMIITCIVLTIVISLAVVNLFMQKKKRKKQA
jgi:hypothetical protein